MNKIMKQLVAFAKLQSTLKNELVWPTACNMQDAIKTDLFNWLQDNLDEIIKVESDEKNHIGLTPNEVEIGLKQNKFECIKAYRSRTGKSLLDCKKDIELYFTVNCLSFGSYTERV